jgi:riboflavin kinase/FMN adenylyltransferase
MQHVDALEAVQLKQASVVTIGAFDGVHRGHQRLISELVSEAHAQGRAAAVICFFPHPDVVLRGITGRYYLTSPDERARLLGKLGVDVLVVHPFNDDVRHVRAADFVGRLREHLNMAAIWATADFAMGYNREGNIDFLRAQGVEVHTIELVAPDSNGERISSSGIRAALEAGDVAKASDWLGRPYRISGAVMDGDKRGRTIGFPTANVSLWDEQVIPANGVYACRVHLGDETFNAVTNVGVRPTFEGVGLTVEAHIFDFDRDIYGQTLAVDFVERLRGEQKFDGIEALVAQIKSDAEQARRMLGSFE